MNMIVGVGNPLRRDEGVGVAAVARLNEYYHLPDNVSAIDAGTPGLGLLDIIGDAESVVLIDAMTAGQPPGTIYQVDPARLSSRGPEWTESLHGVSLMGTIHLAEAVGLEVPPITIVGVEPAVTDWGEELSEPVATALDLVAAIALGLSTAYPHHPTRHRRKEVPVSK